jgi:hypothetical protein
MDDQTKACIEVLRGFNDGEAKPRSREEDLDIRRALAWAKWHVYQTAMGWQSHELSDDGRLDSQRLSDGRVIDLVRDPEHPESTRFACWKDREVSYDGKITVNFDVYGPRRVTAGAFRSVRLPFRAQPYSSLPEVMRAIAEVIGRCVSISSDYAALLGHFVIATWFADRLPTAPYLAVVGMPQAGKTRLLRILELLCRRALLVSDISSTGLLYACEQVHPTLLIDEAGSVRNPNELRRLLRIGSTQPGLVLRKDKAWNVFGAKVISWRKLPDDSALTSRNDSGLMAPEHPEIVAAAETLQEKLLYYRLAHFDQISAPESEGMEKLRPGMRDLYTTLAAPCAAYPEVGRVLFEHFVAESRITHEPLPPLENAVLAALLSATDEREKPPFIGDLTKSVNGYLKAAGEKLRVIPRQVGIALTGLGFTNRRRDRNGWSVLLSETDLQRLQEMAERYGVSVVDGSQLDGDERVSGFEFQRS